MTATKESILFNFIQNAQLFADDIIDLIKAIKGDSIVMTLCKSGVESIFNNGAESLLITFIKETYDHWNSIQTKNEEYFHNHLSTIFGKVGIDLIQPFQKLLKEVDNKGIIIISKDDRNNIWDYIHLLIYYCILYIEKVSNVDILIDLKTYKPIFKALYINLCKK